MITMKTNIEVISSERGKYDEVIAELSKEFEDVKKRNPHGYLDSFEQSFDMHCQTVADRLGAELRIEDDTHTFDFVINQLLHLPL